MFNPPKRYIERKSKQRKNRPYFIGAIDCETIGLHGPIAIWTIYHEFWEEAKVFETFDEVLVEILATPPITLKRTRWYAHNAEYDWRYAVAAFEPYRDQFEFIPCERCEGKLFKISVYTREVRAAPDILGNEIVTTPREIVTEFYDSMALYLDKLEKFTKQFAPEKHKIAFDHEKIIFDKTNPFHINYAKRDVESLVAAVAGFDAKVYETFGVHLRGTISSTAYQACLRFLPPSVKYNRLCVGPEAFVRPAYVGGYVKINAIMGFPYQNVTVADFNSRYPASMKLGVPSGDLRFTRQFISDKPGVYRVWVTVPLTETFPVIALRDKSGSVSYPVGHFETITTSLEISEGMRRGYKVDVIEGYVFDKLEYPFQDFVDTCERLRAEFKGTPTEDVVKRVQNSVYGKFGTKPEGRELMLLFGNEITPIGWHDARDEDDKLVEYYCWRECERDAEYMLPHWAAWITANSRLALFDLAKLVGEENFLYGDTDSAHFHENVNLLSISHMISSRYGDLKIEKVFEEAKYWVPKGYTYILDGVLGATYKGIPKKQLANKQLLMSLHSGEQIAVVFISGTSFETYLKSGKRSIDRSRTSTDPRQVKSHRLDEYGQWRPLIKGV